MTAHDFDLFVIGGGSGGVRAARVAAAHGARVALAEEYRLGGTCVIRGCVPKKLLVYASRFRDDFEDARGFGWTIAEPAFDWPALIAAKDREIARLESVYRANLEKSGVAIFDDRAVLESQHAVRLVAKDRTLTADKILIATGGGPSLEAGLPGIEHAITSNEAFQLAELPRRIVINGGGYIAVEFAGIFAGLGAETTLVYRGDQILRGFDVDLRCALSEAYAKRGIRILTEQVFTRIERTERGLKGHLVDGQALEADRIMFATGRSPNTSRLGLEAAGVKLGRRGEIIVDARSRSSIESVFAVGDVTNRVNLTPVAIREGQAFADSEFGNRPTAVDHAMIPTAVFSTPEIGTVGLAEHEARVRYAKVVLFKSSFKPLRATLAGRDERMMMKLIVEAESGKVVGCHVLGADAAEIIQMAAIAMRMGATKSDFDATMALHPSAAEELVTMRDAWMPAAGSTP